MKKQKQELAETLLTLAPSHEATMEKEGFIGALYRPENDLYPGKVLVMAGGTDGSYGLTRLIAEQFVKQGLSVLALAYWNREGLPTKLQRIPLEYAETAAQWLKGRGYEKIGMWGISQGAIFALLCASYLPELFSCAVGVSPMCVCGQAFQKKNQWNSKNKVCEGSAFSFRNRDIPYFPLVLDEKKILLDSLRDLEFNERSVYAGAIERASEESRIPVERMSGPVLFLAAEYDSLWESKEAAEYMVSRLRANGFAHPVACHIYPMASHYLLPYPMASRKLFRVERKHPKECAQSDQQAFEATLRFLREQW